MAFTLDDVQQKLTALGVNRAATQQDVDNANTHGMAIFDNTFGGGQGIPTNSVPAQSSAQAGQSAKQQSMKIKVPTLDELRLQEAQAIQDESNMATSNSTMESVLGELLKAKAASAPYQKAIAKKNEKLGAISTSDYAGMSTTDMIGAMRDDISRLNAEKGYIQEQQDAINGRSEDLLSKFTDLMNQQLAAAGLRVERIQQQKSDAIQEQQFQQQMARSGGGSGSGSSKETALSKEAADLVVQLDGGKIGWGTAWDYLKAKYPWAENQKIDSLLGGKWNADTGVAEGRAKYGNPTGASGQITDEQVWNQIGNLSPEDQADTEYVRNQILLLGKDPNKFGF